MVLIIDNYDSFTFNLARYFNEVNKTTMIIQNDSHSIAEIEALSPEYLVISPGPGSPKQAGISTQAIKYFSGRLPILGVCLGHQCLAEAFEGNTCPAQEIRHGKTSCIVHNGDPLFENIPNVFTATRYHSLVVDSFTLPEIFDVCANCDDEIMAIKHKKHYSYGVQFHPEAFLTNHGHQLLSNFLEHNL